MTSWTGALTWLKNNECNEATHLRAAIYLVIPQLWYIRFAYPCRNRGKNPLFPASIVLRSILVVLYSAPELLMIQQANFIYLLRRLCCFHLKSFISRYWYISFISRVCYPLFQGWIVLRSIVMVLYSAPELLMIQLANFAKSQISSLQLRKIWHHSLPTGSISNWKFYEQNQLLFRAEFQSKKIGIW